MERIISSRREHFKPVTLYLEDIERIVEILREVSPTVELATEEYIFENLNELSDLKRSFFNDFTILIRNPYIWLLLSRNDICLYIDNDTVQSRGVIGKIKDVLIARKRKGSLLMKPVPTILIIAICAVIGIMAVERKNWIVFGIAEIVTFAGMVLCYWNYNTLSKRYSIIIPKYRIEASSFWESNYNTIILTIFSAILGAFAKTLFDRLWKSTP